MDVCEEINTQDGIETCMIEMTRNRKGNEEGGGGTGAARCVCFFVRGMCVSVRVS